jgi:hypothetical protein
MFRKKFNEFIIVDELNKKTEKSNDNNIDETIKS